jgi:hypothetical protein
MAPSHDMRSNSQIDAQGSNAVCQRGCMRIAPSSLITSLLLSLENCDAEKKITTKSIRQLDLDKGKMQVAANDNMPLDEQVASTA